jgi:hypothetical protein
MAKQLEQLQTQINQLEQEKVQMSQVQAQPQPQESTGLSSLEARLEAKFERLIEEKLTLALSNLAIAQPNQPTQVTQQPVKKQETVDWEGKTNAEVWSSKVKGASEEKIRRSFNAIALAGGNLGNIRPYRPHELGFREKLM